MTAMDLSKQQALDADPKTKQKINFIGNLSSNINRLILDSSQKTVTVL